MKKIITSVSLLLAGITTFAQNQFFEPTNFRGAFAPAPTAMWTNGWTNWDPNATSYGTPNVTITANITNNTTWTANNVYLLAGQIYVKNGATLTIEPGTIIQGDYNTIGSGLFITQGSKINAVGTSSNPIVFTSSQPAGSRLPGDWGGLIILGRGSNNTPGGISNIEGLAPTSDTQFGGGANPDDNDNSGTLKYVRVEFGGYVYQPNKEINGITFGSVGRSTQVDYVQVSFTNDDGFEWFGGAVNGKHLVSYRNLDDDFDTDNGFKGYIQFGIAIRDPQLADNPTVSTSEGFESDNDPTGTTATPLTSALFSNITIIGPYRGSTANTIAGGYRRGARIRRNSNLKIFNSIFMDFPRGIHIDGTLCEANANSGALKFKNNLVAGFSTGRACERNTGSTFNIWSWFANSANDSLVSTSGILTTPYDFTLPDYRPVSGSPALSNSNFSDASFSGLIVCNLSVPSITGDLSICQGETTTLTAPAGFNTYSWTGGGNTQSINVTTAGSYTLTVSDQYGCSASNSVSVAVNTLPTASITGNTSVCFGQSTTLTGNSGFFTYNWIGGAVNGDITQTVTINTGGNYSLVITDANGCKDTANVTVTVNNLPDATISGDLSICQGESTTLSVPSVTGNNYTWNTGSTTNSISATTSGSYSVTVTNAENCQANASVNVNVNSLPTATINGNTTICFGQSTSLTGNSGFFTYNWTGGSNNQSITTSAAGEYSLVLTDVNGCKDTAVVTVTVNSLPDATITGDLSICQGETTTLSVPSVSGNTYLWNDGSTVNTINSSTAGNYSVTVTNSNNCQSSANVNLVVNTLPIVTINGSSAICSGSSTTLSATGVSNFTWLNNNFNAAVLNVSPTSDSTFTAVGTDVNGCRDTASITITVNSLPNMTTQPALANSNCGQSNGSITGAVISGNGGLTFNWTNSLNQSIGTTLDINNLSAGVYNLSVTDGNNCSTSFGPYSISNPGAPATPTVNASATSVCQGANITLTAQTTGNVTYTWSGPSFNANGSSVNLNNVNLSNSGVYAVTATENNCVSQAATITIVVNANPSVNLAATSNSVCINGNNVTLIGLPNGGTYSGTNVSNNQFTPSTAGVNTITYTYTDANTGCSNTATTNITVNALPTVSVSGSVNAICINSTNSVVLTGVPSGGSYSGPGVNGSNFIPSLAGVGTQNIIYSYTDNNGCSNSGTTSITVNNAPIVSLSVASNQACVNSTSLALTPVPSGGVYTGSNAITGNTFNPSTAGVGSQTITYTFTDVNNCSNAANAIINVNGLPTVSLTASATSICLNASSNINLTGVPSGGNYSGNGVSGNTFYPSIAGAGSQTANYTFTDNNGCANSASTNITVNTPPTVSLTASSTSACVNHTVLTLVPIPASGGIFSGTNAITGTNYNPSLAGVGKDTVVYEFTDNNGCSNKAQVIITVSQCTGIENIKDPSSVSMNIYPNPVNTSATIELELDKQENVSVIVYDYTGKVVQTIAENMLMQSGINKLNLDVNELSNGMYIVLLKSDSVKKSMKIMVSK